MDLQTPLLSGALLAIFSAVQYWIHKGRFDAIDRELHQVRTEIAQLRSDLLHVALRTHPQTG